jgi:DNA-binding transcriptional MocR family regulator
VARSARFTRIPKTEQLIATGVPIEVIPTYCALSDYANNKSGLCFPKMETLAHTLKRSVRTIQRHLHLLKSLGHIEFVERRRHKGRYSSYVYRVIHIMRTTTGHGRRVGGGTPINKRTKRSVTPPDSPPKEAFDWLFGKESNPKAEEEYKNHQEQARRREAQRRREGYEWLFR